MYRASKHAIEGFTDSLRIALEEEGAGVAVTPIKPAAIDTHFAENGKDDTDREVKRPPSVYRPDNVAEAIIHGAVRGGTSVSAVPARS